MKLITLAVGAVLALSGVGTASADCGNVSIADMNSSSAEMFAALDKFIFEVGFGCNVELINGATVPSITSLVEKGEPNIVPEAWVDLVPEIVKTGLDQGNIVEVPGPLSDEGEQGLWIPKYMVESNPELTTLAAVLKHPELFPNPENSEQGAIYNGAQGWGSAIVTAQLFKAFRASEAGFALINPGSAAGLDSAIAKAYERRAGIVAFYWSPTALLGKYEMVKLDLAVPHDPVEWKRCITNPSCPDPKVNSWPKDHVLTLVSKRFAENAGPELEYLRKRSVDGPTINKLLDWMIENQAPGDQVAMYFLKEYETVWAKWVAPDVIERIKSAL